MKKNVCECASICVHLCVGVGLGVCVGVGGGEGGDLNKRQDEFSAITQQNLLLLLQMLRTNRRLKMK